MPPAPNFTPTNLAFCWIRLSSFSAALRIRGVFTRGIVASSPLGSQPGCCDVRFVSLRLGLVSLLVGFGHGFFSSLLSITTLGNACGSCLGKREHGRS